MTCTACGEQSKNAADFTKAVIEINNPEQIVLFRKVVIPSSMGDESNTPASIGKYRNVLLVYEINNHAYLYSSDGIPTLLTSDVAKTLEERVDKLEADLADESVTRKDADDALQLEINNKADISSLATVATSGSYADLTNKPTIGDATLTIKRNSASVGTFTANATSDVAIDINVPTTPSDIGAQSIIDSSNKLSSDLIDDSNATNKFVTSAQISSISSALQPADINKDTITNVSLDPTISTSTVKINSTKENLLTGASSVTGITLPVASSTTAGVMNSSTYDTIVGNTNNINALLNGAVAVAGLPSSPTQAALTTAWQTETGLTNLINRASVYDVTNQKVWTYYSNTLTWYGASNTSQVTVSTFTNSSEGTIKGSTNAGQIYAESDGTGSVNGWDTLNNTVAAKANAADLATVATSGSYNDLTNLPTIPTVNNATLTIQNNGTNVATFTANSSSNATANILVPTKTSDLTNDAGFTTNIGTITKVQANGTDIASSGTANIPAATTSAYGVTTLSTSTNSSSTTEAATPSAVKSAYDLADGKATITMTSTDPGEGSPLAANHFIFVYSE